MDLFEIVGKLSLNGVDDANSQLENITGTAKNTSGIFGSVGGKIAGAVGAAFGTAKIIGFGKDVIATTQSFSDAMLKVQSLSGASGEELQKLNDTALQYGSTTAWTSAQVADAMGYMALAGFDTNEIMDSLGGTLSLASASGTDLGVASDILTDALTAFGYSAKDAGLFANVLATTQAKSNTTVEALGEAFKYVAPLAGTYQYSVESVSTALGMMANAGIKGSMAGTSMASIITRLATNTSGARDMIEALGVEFYNSDGSARDLSDVLMELSDATAGMTAQDKASVAQKVAGQEAQKGLLAILNQGSSAYSDLQETLKSCDGTAAEMSSNMESGVGGAIRTMQSAWEGFKIKLGQKFETPIANTLQKLAQFITGTLSPAMSGLIDDIGNVVDWLKQHEAAVNVCISVMEVLTASFIAFKAGAAIQSVVQGFQAAQVTLALFSLETQGASIAQGFLNGQLTLGETIVGLFTGQITLAELATGLFAKGQAALNVVLSANPIGIVVMAIAALVAIFVVAYNHSETFRNAVDGLWQGIQSFLAGAWAFIQTIPANIVAFFEGIKLNIETFIENVKLNFNNGLQAVISFFANLPYNVGLFLGQVLGFIVQWAIDIGTKAIEAGSNFITNIITFFSQLPGQIAAFIEMVITNVSAWAVSFPQKAMEAGSKFLNNVISFVQQLPGKVLSFLNNVISNASKFASDLAAKGKQAAKDMFDNVVNGIKGLPEKMLSIGGDIVHGLWNGISAAGGWLKDQVSNFASGVVDGFKSALKIKSPSRVMRDEVGAYISQGLGVGITEDDSPEKAMQGKLNSLLNMANNTNLNMKSSIDGMQVDNPIQRYQLDFNAQFNALNDGFERLLGLVGEYLPNIADNATRSLVLDGDNLAVGISRQMDAQLGRISLAKARGNV